MISNQAVRLDKLTGINIRHVMGACLYAVLMVVMTACLLLQPSSQAALSAEWNARHIDKHDNTALTLNFHEVRQFCRVIEKTPVAPKDSDSHPAPYWNTPGWFSAIRQAVVFLDAASTQTVYLKNDRIRDPPSFLLLV